MRKDKTDVFANHDTRHSNYFSIFPLFCLNLSKNEKLNMIELLILPIMKVFAQNQTTWV